MNKDKSKDQRSNARNNDCGWHEGPSEIETKNQMSDCSEG